MTLPRLAVLLFAASAALAQEHPTAPAEETPEQTALAARLGKLVDDADAKVKAKDYKAAALAYDAAWKEIEKADLHAATKWRLAVRDVYDLACCLAAAGEKEKAVQALGILAKIGYASWDHVEHDPWLKPLAELDSFKKLVAEGKAAHARPAPARPADELFDDGFYRAQASAAVLAFPGHEGWSVAHTGSGALSFFIGKSPGTFSAKVALDFGAARRGHGEKDLALAKAAAQSLARECLTRNSYLACADAEGKAFRAASGASWEVALSGTDAKIGTWSCLSVAVARGAVAVTAVVWGTPKTDASARSLAQKVLDALRLGDQVPRLEDRKPATVLEGVWLGPYELDGMNQGHQWWAIFDKRGYASWDESPANERSLDLEAFRQGGGTVYRYAIEGGKLELTGTDDAKKKLSLAWSTEGGKLAIDGRRYDRVDGGALAGKKLKGTWEAASYYRSTTFADDFAVSTSSRYELSDDGTFRTEASSGVSGSHHGTDYEGNTVASSDAHDHGTYAIAGDRIVFRYCNGVTIEQTIYPVAARPRLDVGVLYIGGANYLEKRR